MSEKSSGFSIAEYGIIVHIKSVGSSQITVETGWLGTDRYKIKKENCNCSAGLRVCCADRKKKWINREENVENNADQTGKNRGFSTDSGII